MASAESLIAALARGLIEGLMGTTEERKPKKERPVVVQTDAINAAVRQYLDDLAAQEQPAQQELFPQAEVDLGDAIYNRVQEARARAEAQNQDEPEPGTYRPDMPEGAPWQSPVK